MSNRERLLKLLLRIVGTTSLLAVGAVVMPYAWMNAMHEWLGMGPLPGDPIVGYLARSISLFYALFGGLLWVVSLDVHRHRLVLHYLGAAIIMFGGVVFAVDQLERMPILWSRCEGPIDVAFGIVILSLNYRTHQIR